MSDDRIVAKHTALRRNIVTMMIAHGPELTLLQRFGYLLFALFALAIGVSFLAVVKEQWRGGSLLGVATWTIPAMILIATGLASIVNVLRFPKTK